MVVCYHFTWELLGARYPILRNPVTAWFLNGDFAVSIFFVLSGIALTSGYFTNGDRRILVGLAVKRYSRLTIPILVTCFLTFALYQLGLTYCGSASVVVARPDWIGSWLSEPVTLLRWAQYSLAEVYIIRNHTTALNAFLWTMQVEMWASFAIFAGLLARNARDYIWITLILAFAIAGLSIEIHPFVLFGFGAAFSFATSRRGAATLTGHRLCQVSALAIMTIVAAIQSWAHVNGANEAIAAYSAIAFVYAALTSRPFRALLELPVSRFLGRISLNLYLLQFPVMISFSAASLVWLSRTGSFSFTAAMLVSAASIVICIVLALLMTPLDNLTQRVGAIILSIYDDLSGDHQESWRPE